ncbi:MAG: response regulator transcription factor [Myxococcales bacterium]|nr:response regulator transcription factor [Myxococcales bacterium]
MIRIIIADDHAMFRHGLRQVLGDQPDMTIVAEASSLAELRSCLATPADIAILDLSMPDVTGTELVTAVAAAAPHLKKIILTMYPEDQLALHLIAAGAYAYLNKTRPPSELLLAIRKAVRGERYLTDTLSEVASATAPTPKLPHETLSSREYQVFLLVLQGRSPHEMATALELGPSTISTHLSGVKAKLGVSTLSEILIYGHRVGLLG